MYGGELLGQGTVGSGEGSVCSLIGEELGCEGGAGGLGGCEVLPEAGDFVVGGLIWRASRDYSRSSRGGCDAFAIGQTSV